MTETLKLISKMPFIFKSPPHPFETLESWGRRVLGEGAASYILFPALQGIYAGDPAQLSATLLTKRLFERKTGKPPAHKGLVSPEGGMEVYFEKMKNYLESKGVKFHFQVHPQQLEPMGGDSKASYVTATSLRGLADLPLVSEIHGKLQNVEMVSLSKVTLFYPDDTHTKIRGFGILFPRQERIRSLGVLFNDQIFERKSSVPQNFSESYILGGAIDREIEGFDDAALLEVVRADRRKLFREDIKPIGTYISRWPQTLPHYSIGLERLLQDLKGDFEKLEGKGIFITGNFLGGIGLSQLLEQARFLPERILKHG